MIVKLLFNGSVVEAEYNKQTDFYEIDLTAPELGGVYEIAIDATDAIGDTSSETKDIQVLAKEVKEYAQDESIVYFLDKADLEIKDVIEFENYEYNIDEETNAKTVFDISRKNSINNGDIVILKRSNNIDYIGIVENAQNEDGEQRQRTTLKYISNIFDKKVILKNEDIIFNQGIEDFIARTINDEFTNSNDTLLNIGWLDVEVLTHTTLQKSVDTENDIYNFHTFITNCTQNYNIILDFSFENNRIKLKIYKQEQETELIDATTDDICNYVEVYETDVLAKVTVKTDTDVLQWFLKSDRTITQNINDQDRAIGKEDVIYTSNNDDAYQTALNAFKGNSYNHYISFYVYKESLLFNVKNLKIGTPLSVRTDNNVILDTYISAISDNGGKFMKITCGNMRINFIDKINQERRKNK